LLWSCWACGTDSNKSESSVFEVVPNRATISLLIASDEDRGTRLVVGAIFERTPRGGLQFDTLEYG
jgi:hypothetical protein